MSRLRSVILHQPVGLTRASRVAKYRPADAVLSVAVLAMAECHSRSTLGLLRSTLLGQAACTPEHPVHCAVWSSAPCPLVVVRDHVLAVADLAGGCSRFLPTRRCLPGMPCRSADRRACLADCKAKCRDPDVEVSLTGHL